MSALGFDFGYGRLVLFVRGYGLDYLDFVGERNAEMSHHAWNGV